MDWLEPLRKDTERIRKDTERIRQENIKIKEETERLREETERLREENRMLERIAKERVQIKEEQKLKRIDKELLQENLIYNKQHIKQSMKIFLDTADVELIKPAYDTGLLDGITTNPTLILKSGRQLKEVITEISETFPNLESISAEVVGDTMEEMWSQALDYTNIPNVTIKVPCTVEGLKVCKELTSDVNIYDGRMNTVVSGKTVNVTLVFSVAQAILAAKAGATYTSPFVGRLEDQSFDGLGLIKSIREVYDHMGTKTKILAASIRDVRQVEQCARYGADVVTIPPLVFWKMYKHSFTESGLAQFNADYLEANKNQY